MTDHRNFKRFGKMSNDEHEITVALTPTEEEEKEFYDKEEQEKLFKMVNALSLNKK